LAKLHFSEDPSTPNEEMIQPVLCDCSGNYSYAATSVLALVTCRSCIRGLERRGRLKSRNK
jgi:hypothetical protein